MQSPVFDIVEGGARRKARKACPKGKVRGSKSKRCHFRRKSGPHRKSAPSSARRLRGGLVGGNSVQAPEPILTAGALEEAFQAGLEAGRAFRGGLEAPVVDAPIVGGSLEVVDLEAGARRSKKRSAKKSRRSGKKVSKRRSAKKSHKRSHKKSRKHSRRA